MIFLLKYFFLFINHQILNFILFNVCVFKVIFFYLNFFVLTFICTFFKVIKIIFLLMYSLSFEHIYFINML